MPNTRTVEIFTAGCPLCDEVVERVRDLACEKCDISVVSLEGESGARRAEEVGVQTLPAVAVKGVLADCCEDRRVREADLRAGGIGTPL